MITIRNRLSYATPCGAIVLAALLVTACVPPNIAPQQVQASNPTVTYTYRGDQELLVANQNAMAFCSQYRAGARTLSITEAANAGKTVVFECSPSLAPVALQQPYNPNMPYTYRTDQELLDATQNAQITCMNSGPYRAQSTVVTNPNGVKTVTFQCVPR